MRSVIDYIVFILQRDWMLRKAHSLVLCGSGTTCSISQRLGKFGRMGLCIGMHAVVRYVFDVMGIVHIGEDSIHGGGCADVLL